MKGKIVTAPRSQRDYHDGDMPRRSPVILVVLRGDLVQFVSALWTRIGRPAPLLGSREHTELLHHAKVIAHSPVLGDPAVL